MHPSAKSRQKRQADPTSVNTYGTTPQSVVHRSTNDAG